MPTFFDILNTWLRVKSGTERGGSLVEYALMVALIAVVCVVAITGLGTKVSGNFNSTAGKL